MNYPSKALILVATLFTLTAGEAKTFQNEYLSFEIPDNWSCSQISPNWICEPDLASERKFALVTVTSKEAGTLDQLSNFEGHLSRPRSHQMGSSTPIMSQVMETKRRKIRGHEWVQSLHLNSEVNNFYTLYLATKKDPLAIMITMSAEKGKWNYFNSVFEDLIKSLQLKTVNMRRGSSGGSGFEPVAPQNSGMLPQQTVLEDQTAPRLPTIYVVGLVLAGLILLAAIYLTFKK